MRTFASALTLFAASKAASLSQYDVPYALPQYDEHYMKAYDWWTPQYLDYQPYVEYPKRMYPSAREYPLLADTLSASLAWANPYWPSQYTKKSVYDDVNASYDEAVKIVAGAANAADYQERKTASLDKYLPHHPPRVEYHEPKMIHYPRTITQLPVHKVVTPFEWYVVSGQCDLTDEAYAQCVEWKQGGEYSGRKDAYRASYGDDKKSWDYKEPSKQKYQKTVAKVNPKTSMAYLDTEVGTYEAPKKEAEKKDDDLYRGHTVLPVDITDAYGLTTQGRMKEQDLKGDVKQVTIINDQTGQQSTLKIKDSQNVVHVQEVDDEQDVVYDKWGYAQPVYAADSQLLTVCDEETYTCEVIELDLDKATPEYLDHAYEHIEEVEQEYKPASEPVLIDPASVGADADDVCWLEDIVVGIDGYGQDIVESEVFCAAGDDLYVEPVYVDYEEPVYEEPKKEEPKYEAPVEKKAEPMQAPPVYAEPAYPSLPSLPKPSYGGPKGLKQRPAPKAKRGFPSKSLHFDD